MKSQIGNGNNRQILTAPTCLRFTVVHRMINSGFRSREKMTFAVRVFRNNARKSVIGIPVTIFFHDLP
jgi:hypothetical protein